MNRNKIELIDPAHDGSASFTHTGTGFLEIEVEIWSVDSADATGEDRFQRRLTFSPEDEDALFAYLLAHREILI